MFICSYDNKLNFVLLNNDNNVVIEKAIIVSFTINYLLKSKLYKTKLFEKHYLNKVYYVLIYNRDELK